MRDPSLFPSVLLGGFSPLGARTDARASDYPSVASQPPASSPEQPSSPPGGLWDSNNRSRTLLAIGAGLLSGRDFASGVGAAANNLLGLQGSLQSEQRKTREFGGPDNSFEIITDPTTGERTYRPVEAFQGYLKDKATKPKDTADMNGRVMFALQQLPADQRATAYAGVLANPGRYGVDPETMPPEYDPNYVAMSAGIGMTVSQAIARRQAEEKAAADREARAKAQADREARTRIIGDRAAASTRQAEERLSLSRTRGGGRLPKVPPGNARQVSVGNSDLSYVLN